MIRHVEVAVINQKVTRYPVDPLLSNLAQHLPNACGYQERVAIAFEQQVAVQNIAICFPQQVGFRLPGIGRAEDVQGHKCCQQLDDRCRVARNVFIPGQDWLARIEVLNIDAKATVGRPTQVQRTSYARRQHTVAKPKHRQDDNYQGQESDSIGHVRPLNCGAVYARRKS